MRALPYLARLVPRPVAGPGVLTPPRRPVTRPSDLVDPDDPARHPFGVGRDPEPDSPPAPTFGPPDPAHLPPTPARTGARHPRPSPTAPNEGDAIRSLRDSGWWDDAPGPGAGGSRQTGAPDRGPRTAGPAPAGDDRWRTDTAELRPPDLRLVPTDDAPGTPAGPRQVPEVEALGTGHPGPGQPPGQGQAPPPPTLVPTGPTPPVQSPQSWEWASGEPLDLGLLRPSRTAADGTTAADSPPAPAPATTHPAEAPTLDRGPRPRASTDPEPPRPTLTIGTIEVTVVPPPPAPPVAPPPPAVVTAAHPSTRPTGPTLGSWYGMAQS